MNPETGKWNQKQVQKNQDKKDQVDQYSARSIQGRDREWTTYRKEARVQPQPENKLRKEKQESVRRRKLT